MSNLAALYKKDLQMSCMPSVSQVEFSRQAKAPQPTWRALLRQRATSAVGTENGPSAGELHWESLHTHWAHCTRVVRGFSDKMQQTKEAFCECVGFSFFSFYRL